MLKKLVLLLTVTIATSLSAESKMGDDGLHKTDWMRTTFFDMSEDLLDANAEGKRFAVIWEQRGCIYCRKMHEEVFPDPEIEALIEDNFFVVQLNMFGDVEVTDFDGETLSEKDMALKWGVVFTPTIMFFDDELPPTGTTAADAAIVSVPGAFGKFTTFNIFSWILEKGNEGDEHFQKYHARKIEERRQN